MIKTIVAHRNSRICILAGAAAAMLSLSAVPISAQGTNSQEAIDAIVGSDVEEQQTQSQATAAEVIAAIENTAATREKVRKVTVLSKVDIVYLTDAGATEGGPPSEIAEKIEEHDAQISQLRQDLEGNAMLFHAIDSRQILLQDIIAVTFPAADAVTIYAAGKPVAGDTEGTE